MPGFQARSERDLAIGLNHVSENYFEVLGVPLLQGRAFTRQDDANAPQVAILNETAARFYFPERNPIGAIVHFDKQPAARDIYRIVGIVKDNQHNNLLEEFPRFVYVPVRQPRDRNTRLTLMLRTASDPNTVVGPVRDLVRHLGPDILVTRVTTLEQQLDATLLQQRIISTLSSFFGLLALLLADVGLYGILAYSVAQRTSEIGIRMALGAQPSVVANSIVRQTLWLVGLGIAVGLPAAILSAQAVETLFYGLKPSDPSILSGCALLLLTVAVAASFLPARKASRIDPMVALRYE